MLRRLICRLLAPLCLTVFVGLAAASSGLDAPQTHTYYIAADEVEWDYAPSGMNKMMGMKFDGYPLTFIEQGPHRIGKVYRKAVYREYTDETFSHLKPRAPEWEHAGILGPILRAEVGDTIVVHFKNNATRPYSLHPHGVFYNKDSEGSMYEDGTSGADKEDDAMPPGHTHLYTWQVPERAGPGPNDPSSLVWLYHSHGSRDVESGLIGAIIITRRGMAGPDGKPKDVDREFVSLFMFFDENASWYLDHNIQTYASDPKGVKKLEFNPADNEGNLSPTGTGFAAANFKATINGYMYALGEGVNFHTPHWHGNVVMDHGKRTDVVTLMPAQMLTVDMVPDDLGIWLYHCHIDEHMDAGMVALYKVEP